ncbi:hypothetical protein E4U42_001820 [Claviceps africana]|uniref:YycE-like C-terminal domain-containing protein n=1 Tax=Claviceps africana TaxID=83212 RepID=A0A8K0NJ15_9HYPO|nr:hypothetical protein E4U42_001820 [Claviceps africana]
MAPTQGNLLVFYLPQLGAYHTATSRMRYQGFDPVASFNPFWDRFGQTFEDADGYRVVLMNLASPTVRAGA